MSEREDFRDRARAAMVAMRSVFPATPLLRNDHLSEKFGADIWLKREDLSPVRSYKLRGAFNAMRRAQGATLFVCASAGNHAQGVAYMCRHFGVGGVIFMPVTTPQQKIDKTRIFGGDMVEIRLVGDYFDDTLAEAKAFCDAEGGHFLAPFDDDDVILGQASIAAEIEAEMPGGADVIVLPVGGGGLSAGIRSYFGPEQGLKFVEPAGGMSLAAAVDNDGPVTLNKVDSFVDGAAVARIGERPWARLKGIARDDVLNAPEDRICTTMLEMLNIEGIVLEPAGALAVDALGAIRDEIRGKRVICITSGGNFDFERLPEVKERAQRYSGIKKYLILRLPQRPGALKEFLNLLGPNDDIARFEYLKKSARNFGSVMIGIEAQQAEDFEGLFARLDERGFTYRDITQDTILAEFLI
ncbi:MAG: threonine ammonia-lyase IlvA [Pseudooceanicola atlanticus]